HPTASTIESHGKGTTKPRPETLPPSSHVIRNAPQSTAHQLVQLIKHILTRFGLSCCPNPAVSHSPAHSPLPEKHLKTHSPEHTHSTQDFQCTFCSKSFQVQRYLNTHLKKHNTKRIMQCEHCQQCFKTTRALNKHLQTHSTLTFNCTFCNEDFTGEMDLHNHMQIHSTERFVCKICDKHFHARRYLTNHLKTHSLMNSFQCQHCSKTFTRQKSLKAHLNTHSTEQTHSKKIFQCTICSKTFRVTKSFMHKHRIQFSGTYGCCHCKSTSP
uniref:C2H2-type domain-containing protein n=1 Tax=Erpetoichthys calabaricus TaxID=27687 RepID=A0A8C4RM79_ERPCA